MNLHLELADKNWGISFEKKKFREKIQIYSANFRIYSDKFQIYSAEIQIFDTKFKINEFYLVEKISGLGWGVGEN